MGFFDLSYRYEKVRVAEQIVKQQSRSQDRSRGFDTVFDTPMFVNACALYRWAHKVRDKFRGQYSVSGIE
jgi:hypothetical protein